MNRVKFPLVVVLGLGMALLTAHGREPKKNDLMRQKLEHSQKVLEGIAVGDFKMIQKHAEELLEIIIVLLILLETVLAVVRR